MATPSAGDQTTRPRAGQHDSVTVLLRLEALFVVAGSAVAYAHTGTSWWLFAALWLVPDLSMLGYAGGRPCWGARIYNAAHTYVLPATLALLGWQLHAQIDLAIALVWINHIAVDRVLGYGLKYAAGFGSTHLGRLGKTRA